MHDKKFWDSQTLEERVRLAKLKATIDEMEKQERDYLEFIGETETYGFKQDIRERNGDRQRLETVSQKLFGKFTKNLLAKIRRNVEERIEPIEEESSSISEESSICNVDDSSSDSSIEYTQFKPVRPPGQ